MLLKNCKLLQKGKPVIRNILIERGVIKSISKQSPKAKQVIDVNGKYVLPGVIDPHVHCRDPGQTYKENFYTASKAAAAGGVTTFLDMPNNKIPITTVKRLEDKRKRAKKSIVNYGFHFGTEGDFKEIEKAKNKTASTKIYMDVTTGHLIVSDKKKIEEIFKHSKQVSVHAEGENVKLAVELAKKTNKRLYLCHISTENEIKFLKKNKTKNIFVEVSPHHLLLKKKFKVKPSLKTKKDQDALWQGIKEGLVDTIGSDHAPHLKKERCFGLPGLETMLPLMLDAVNKKKLTLTQLVRLTSTNPAKIFNIKNKGLLKVGYDADLVVVDMDLVKKVGELKTKCKWSPYTGWELKGWPVMTFVNGKLVYDQGKIYDNKGKEVEFT